MEGIYKQKPRVANLGILLFYKGAGSAKLRLHANRVDPAL